MKYDRKVLIGQDNWARFFHPKYVGDKHISLLNPNKGSGFWKMIIKCILLILNHSKWRVHDENISFWRDKWLDSRPLVDSLSVVEFLKLKLVKVKFDDGSDVELLERLVGEAKANKICNALSSQKNDNDLLVWMENKEGSFSSKSAWHCIGIISPKVEWAQWIWHAALLKKIVFFFGKFFIMV